MHLCLWKVIPTIQLLIEAWLGSLGGGKLFLKYALMNADMSYEIIAYMVQQLSPSAEYHLHDIDCLALGMFSQCIGCYCSIIISAGAPHH